MDLRHELCTDRSCRSYNSSSNSNNNNTILVVELVVVVVVVVVVVKRQAGAERPPSKKSLKHQKLSNKAKNECRQTLQGTQPEPPY